MLKTFATFQLFIIELYEYEVFTAIIDNNVIYSFYIYTNNNVTRHFDIVCNNFMDLSKHGIEIIDELHVITESIINGNIQSITEITD